MATSIGDAAVKALGTAKENAEREVDKFDTGFYQGEDYRWFDPFYMYWVFSMGAAFWWGVLFFDISFFASQYGPFTACWTGLGLPANVFSATNGTCVPGNYSEPTIPALVFWCISMYLLTFFRPMVWTMSGWSTYASNMYARRFDTANWALFFGIVAYFCENGNAFSPFSTKQLDTVNQSPVPNVNNTIDIPSWRKVISTNASDPAQVSSIFFACLAVVVWLAYLASFFRGTNTTRSRLAWFGSANALFFIYVSLGCNVGPIWMYANLNGNGNILSFVSKQCILVSVIFWALGAFETLALWLAYWGYVLPHDDMVWSPYGFVAWIWMDDGSTVLETEPASGERAPFV